MKMNWSKVVHAMLHKAEEYQTKAENETRNPGLSAHYKIRAINMREKAEFLLAGLTDN